jgi:hypothetical protein
MAKASNSPSQFAKQIVEAATGEKLEIVGFPKEKPMPIYFVIHGVPKGHPEYNIITERIKSYDSKELLHNVFLVANNTPSDILTHEIIGTKQTYDYCFVMTPYFDTKPHLFTPSTKILCSKEVDEWIDERLSMMVPS